jgi:hypothetical protein
LFFNPEYRINIILMQKDVRIFMNPVYNQVT